MRARGSFSGSIRNISPIRNFSPDARRLLDAAKQTQAQKAAEVALSLRRAAAFKRTDSGRIEIATAKGVKRRTWNFGKRVVAGFRSEHTIGSFLYPQDVETASLTDPQIGQIFWNMALTEAMVLAMLFDSSTKGQVRPVQMIILAVISGGLAVSVGLLSRAIFRWGNRGRKRLLTDLRLDGPSKKGFSTVDPVSALAALGAAAKQTVASSPARPRRSLKSRDGELLSPRLTAALETLANRSLGLRVRCAARVRRTLSAVRRRWRAGAFFRGKLRRICSWAVNCTIYFMLCWMVITYAMQFGEKKTHQWLLSWVVASCHAWLVIEPAEVILIALLPQLLENRCISNCKEFAKELGVY